MMSTTEQLTDAWYVLVKGQQSKPVSFERLCKLGRQGKLTPKHQVRTAGTGWVDADSIVGLIPDNKMSDNPTAIESSGTKIETPTAVPASQRTNEEISTFWSCRIRGSNYGPFQFETLVNMVVQGELTAADQVRAENGFWRSVSQIPELKELLNSGVVHEAQPIPQENLTALKAAETWKSTKVRHAEQRRSRTINIAPYEPERESVGIVGQLQALFADTVLQKIVAAVVCVALLAGTYSYLTSIPTGSYIEQLMQVQVDVQMMRMKNAPMAEWDDYMAQFENDSKSMVSVLEKKASTKKPALQHLLWASRDAAPEMLRDARKDVSASEMYFNKELQAARELLE